MATNIHNQDGDQFVIDVPADTASGDCILVGDALACVALTDRGADGKATVKTNGVVTATVTGALDAGDVVYITDAGALTATVGSNVHWGYALDTKGSGSGDIRVKVGH